MYGAGLQQVCVVFKSCPPENGTQEVVDCGPHDGEIGIRRRLDEADLRPSPELAVRCQADRLRSGEPALKPLPDWAVAVVEVTRETHSRAVSARRHHDAV